MAEPIAPEVAAIDPEKARARELITGFVDGLRTSDAGKTFKGYHEFELPRRGKWEIKFTGKLHSDGKPRHWYAAYYTNTAEGEELRVCRRLLTSPGRIMDSRQEDKKAAKDPTYWDETTRICVSDAPDSSFVEYTATRPQQGNTFSGTTRNSERAQQGSEDILDGIRIVPKAFYEPAVL